MRDTQEEIKKFMDLLYEHAIRKSNLYDGASKPMGVDESLRYAIEELGEVATAITRERLNSASDECLDLAHCAMLIFFAVKRRQEEK